MKRLLSFLLCVLMSTSASAQQRPATPYERAIAAGYKALTVCSGIFNAGRTVAQIEALELKGIYPEYDAIVSGLVANVDELGRRVSVRYDEQQPPRLAVWRRNLGCSQLPIGAGEAAVQALPRFDASAPQLDGQLWPLGDRKATARVRGNSRGLVNSVNAAFDDARFGERTQTTAVVVLQRGRIVAEQYRDGFGPTVSQRTWSVGKSIAGAMIGVATGKHLVDINQPVAIKQWQGAGDPRAQITTENLLRMASGLTSAAAGNRTDALYFGGATVDQESVAAPLLMAPGATYRYANNDTVLAVLGLRETIADDAAMLAFPYTELLWKIGMTRTFVETDWKGNFVLSSQVWTTARDLARFGLLHQNDGVFMGQRILPDSWVQYATRPSGPQPEGSFGYGATLWLLNESPGVPVDTYGAFGNRGQYVIIVPSRQIVIVRRGEDPTGARFDIAKFTAELLTSLK